MKVNPFKILTASIVTLGASGVVAFAQSLPPEPTLVPILELFTNKGAAGMAFLAAGSCAYVIKWLMQQITGYLESSAEKQVQLAKSLDDLSDKIVRLEEKLDKFVSSQTK